MPQRSSAHGPLARVDTPSWLYVATKMDPHLVAYREKRSTDDDIITLLQELYAHLNTTRT